MLAIVRKYKYWPETADCVDFLWTVGHSEVKFSERNTGGDPQVGGQTEAVGWDLGETG